MSNYQKPVRIRIETGRPKRKSGVYVRVLHWGIHGAGRRRNSGVVVNLKAFQQFQLEEGPDMFDGLKFKLIPCETSSK
jgi:hypothetical protein